MQNTQMPKCSLEKDLMSAQWISDKIRESDSYAQNVYAALCNMQYQKNDVVEILKDQLWSCSWRYAGGIIADIRQEGDYMDWYCSGIGFDQPGRKYVSEGVVTDEVREDFFKLGWIPVPYDDDNL